MHTIGQVLFVVFTKKNQVYPMQVVEVIIKKTLQGEEVRYLFRGGSDKGTNLFLDQVDGEVFDSADKARSTLVVRATTQINRLVDNALAKSKEWYGIHPAREPQTIDDLPDLSTMQRPPVGHDDIDEAPIVELPNGTMARLRKMPNI